MMWYLCTYTSILIWPRPLPRSHMLHPVSLPANLVSQGFQIWSLTPLVLHSQILCLRRVPSHLLLQCHILTPILPWPCPLSHPLPHPLSRPLPHPLSRPHSITRTTRRRRCISGCVSSNVTLPLPSPVGCTPPSLSYAGRHSPTVAAVPVDGLLYPSKLSNALIPAWNLKFSLYQLYLA